MGRNSRMDRDLDRIHRDEVAEEIAAFVHGAVDDLVPTVRRRQVPNGDASTSTDREKITIGITMEGEPGRESRERYQENLRQRGIAE